MPSVDVSQGDHTIRPKPPQQLGATHLHLTTAQAKRRMLTIITVGLCFSAGRLMGDEEKELWKIGFVDVATKSKNELSFVSLVLPGAGLTRLSNWQAIVGRWMAAEGSRTALKQNHRCQKER